MLRAWIGIGCFVFSFSVILGSSAQAEVDPCRESKAQGPKDKKKEQGERKELENLCPANSGAGAVRADFNGDTIADLAVGVPSENIGSAADAGAVNVIYGTVQGLAAPLNQFWHQDSPGVSDVAEAGDGFGSALAGGDFNNDGFADLAIGVPFEDFSGLQDAGKVNLLYGSSTGLRATPPAASSGFSEISQNTVGILGEAASGDLFGFALAWGQFGITPHADLAIGVPGETVVVTTGTTTVNVAGAGAVNVLYGHGAQGFTNLNNQLWTQNTPGVNDASEALDHFGSSLSAGNFGNGPEDDLVVGVRDENIGNISDAGGANVLYGSPNGLASAGNQFWHQNVTSVEGVSATGDHFASAVAAGDFNGDGLQDLAIGVPHEDIADIEAESSVTDAGVVNVLYGSSSGLTATGNQLWSQALADVPNTAEDGDQFGTSLAANDFDHDGHDDLAVGVPFEDLLIGNVNFVDGGAVNAIYGSSAGLTGAGSQLWAQESQGVLEEAGFGDQFGASVSAWDFNGDAFADLAIGVPFEDLGDPIEPQQNEINAGAINVLYGSAAGLTATGNQLWTQDSPDILDQAEKNDSFGKVQY